MEKLLKFIMGVSCLVIVLVIVTAPARYAANARLRQEEIDLCSAKGMVLSSLRQGSGRSTYERGICVDADGRLYAVK